MTTGPLTNDERRHLARLAARERRRAWEFWPSWAVYLPLAPTIAAAALRARSITACAAANPAIPFGGFVGESKHDILQRLDPSFVVATELIPKGTLGDRVAHLEAFMRNRNVDWPVILKPDIGERGTGVRVARSADDARRILERRPDALVAQRYHPGPHEAGILFTRHPDDPHARIFSITDKRFAAVTGDGQSPIEALVWRHPRLRVQAHTFLERLGPRVHEIPAVGVTVPLGIAGNHCRGTMFLDGAHLITNDLAKAIDRAIPRTSGLNFGRLDVRYADPKELRRGGGFSIIELNGLLSESTNIYDPSNSFWDGQRILREQWRTAYKIGTACKAHGAPQPSLRALLATIRSHMFRPGANDSSD